MHRTHYVVCCKCKSHIAMWSGFGDNWQSQKEYACDNQKIPHTFHDGSTDEISCEYINEASYCERCAKELNYKCMKCETGQILYQRG